MDRARLLLSYPQSGRRCGRSRPGGASTGMAERVCKEVGGMLTGSNISGALLCKRLMRQTVQGD
jgi:hypothetical protein